MQTSRPLAAVLAAEVIGHGRALDGDDLVLLRDRLIGRAIGTYGGHIVKQAGGGLVARFTTNLAAVRCALSIQDHIKAREEAVGEEDGLAARIGIDLGHVTFETQSVKGEGTVIAEALRDLTDAGGLSITRIVYLQVRDEIDVRFVEVGKLTFRHLPESVQVFRMVQPGLEIEPEQKRERWRPSPMFYAGALCAVGALSLVVGGFGIWADLQEPGMSRAVVASAKTALTDLSPFSEEERDPRARDREGGQELTLADRLTPDETFFERLGLTGGGSSGGGSSGTVSAPSGRTSVARVSGGGSGGVGSASYGRASGGSASGGVASAGVMSVGQINTGVRQKAQTWSQMSGQLRLSEVRAAPPAEDPAAPVDEETEAQLALADEEQGPAAAEGEAETAPTGAAEDQGLATAEAELPAGEETEAQLALAGEDQGPAAAEGEVSAEMTPETATEMATESELAAADELEEQLAGTAEDQALAPAGAPTDLAESEATGAPTAPDEGAAPEATQLAALPTEPGEVAGSEAGADAVPEPSLVVETVPGETLLVAAAPQQDLSEQAVLETSAGRPVEVRSFPAGDAAPVMVMPVRGALVEIFGQDLGDDTTKGVIMTARPDDAVLAPYDGQVVFADVFRGYGPVVIIEHGEAYHTVLAGLEEIDAQVGQWVLAGEPIGNVGDPVDDSPEVYLELRERDRPVDPLPWLTNAEERRPNMSGFTTSGGDVN